MDLYKLLTDDHKKVKDLFKKALAKDDVDKEIVKQICDELLLHMQKEEKFLYPVILELKDVRDMGKEATEEHNEAKTLIHALQRNNLTEEKYIVKVELLQLGIEHHVEEEENELFPKLKKILPKEKSDEIAKQMQAFTATKRDKVLVKH